MKDVALLAGVHTSTVSLGLRDDPRINVQTRLRIKNAARELDYSVNPVISAWVSSRRSGRDVQSHLPLAYLSIHPPHASRKVPFNHSTFLGVELEGMKLGYSVTNFDFLDFAKNPARLDKILRTRGVQGIVIGPSVYESTISGLDWERYSIVNIGYSLQSPVVHRVFHDESLKIQMAFELCLKYNCKRIGMAILRPHNRILRNCWEGTFMSLQKEFLLEPAIPVLYKPTLDMTTEANEWVGRYSPDVILTENPNSWPDSPVPCLGFSQAFESSHAGVFESNREVGQRAANLVIDMINRNERGLPKHRVSLMVEPVLYDYDFTGGTLADTRENGPPR